MDKKNLDNKDVQQFLKSFFAPKDPQFVSFMKKVNDFDSKFMDKTGGLPHDHMKIYNLPDDRIRVKINHMV